MPASTSECGRGITCVLSTSPTLRPAAAPASTADQKSTRLNSSHGYISYAVSLDRKSTRVNSSHGYISYAVFCLKKKKPKTIKHGHPALSIPCCRCSRILAERLRSSRADTLQNS